MCIYHELKVKAIPVFGHLKLGAVHGLSMCRDQMFVSYLIIICLILMPEIILF